MFESILSALFAPLLALHPVISVFVIGVLISTIMSIVNKKSLSSGKAKEVKERMQSVREEMLKAQKSGDKDGMDKYLNDLMEINNEYMKFMFKPMFVSLALVLLFLPWIRSEFSGMTVAVIPAAIPVIGGFQLSWLWWYILTTLTVTLVLKKVLGF